MNMEQVALIIVMASVVAGYCPHGKIHNTGNCSYRIHCLGNIRGFRLPDYCMEASNDPVTVDLTLTEAIERFDEHIDQKFVALITTLRISGNWPRTELSLLKYTTRLENLFLLGNQIETISGQPFYTLNNLDVLDLSHNKLSQIDHLFRFELQSNKLRILYLAHNKIQNISDDAFAELTSLTELDLSHNLISDLTAEPFSNLTSLEILRLNNNSIINLNGAVNNLHNLNHLYLRGNQIENIDEKSLNIVTHLETFDVSSNHLEEINSDMFSRHWRHFSGSHAVCKIILSGNHITFVPNATATEITTRFERHAVGDGGNADVFTELDLSDNDISSIEYRAFQSLINLTSLNLSNNKLIDFTVNANDVAYVKFLNLSGNHICRLYFESFSSMRNLQNLDLSHNNLEYIPDQTFYNNYNLRHVNMTYNAIEKVENLHINMFHHGGILDLSNNGLFNLRIPYGEGLRLTVLMLHSNNISDPSLIDLRHQTDLKSLDLSHNKIRELRENSLRLPVSLIYLDLSSNQIENIAPSTFLRIWHLNVLNLAHNYIKVIDYGVFRGMSSLLTLDLSYNRIRMLDSKLLMDLKSLSILLLRYNGLKVINDEGWYGHKTDLKVILDGNNLTCEWLADALKNHNNGYTKMRPTVSRPIISGNSVDGIPCTPKESKLGEMKSMVMVDERLLLTSQKILEAVKEQTSYLRKYIWRSIQKDAQKMKSVS